MTQASRSRPSLLLDTSAIVAVFRRDQVAIQRFAAISPVISTIVIGELQYGAMRAVQQARQLMLIADLIANSRVVMVDEAVARQYGTLKHTLELAGQPIPDNDLWIAATA